MNPALKEVRVQGHRWLGKSLVVAQLAISMILVVGATLFLRTLVNLRSVDPAAFGIAASILGLTALVAGWLPARRASHVDPLIALRHE